MWHFRKMSRGEMNQDPTQEDFFNTDHLDDFSDALVREAIQNSLDAKVNNSTDPVHVRIFFPEHEQMLSPTESSDYFGTLRNHLSASHVIHELPDFEQPSPYLVFEDFGTRGLVGDPAASDDPAQDEPSDFYYFWRNVGRGKKGGEERGRWGLGKTMFPASSKIHSFLGFTVRSDDRKRLLMGQSVLSIHNVNGAKRDPYGYFGIPDSDDGFVIPIEDHTEIEHFISSFELTRSNEPGLSVVVPYPRDEISAQRVRSSAIGHYFFPILSGELVIEICDGHSITILDHSTIEKHAKEIGDDDQHGFLGTIRLAKQFLVLNNDSIAEASAQNPNRSPDWNEELFSSSQLDKFAEQLDSDIPVAIRIPVNVSHVGYSPDLSYFHLIIERDRGLEYPLDVFIRSGITISGVHSLRESGIRCLVIVRDLPLVTMLGDAENPAHTEWQERSRNFVGKYRIGRSTLKFVKEAPRGFLRMLNRRSEYIDDTALRHVFPDDSRRDPDRKSPAPGPTPDPTATPKPKPRIDGRPQIFRVTKSREGFAVRLTDHGASLLPLSFSIRMAYDIRRGNPFKHWVPADFDLEKKPPHVTISSGVLDTCAANRIDVTAESADFSVSVNGFDGNRDLIVDVRRESDADATKN